MLQLFGIFFIARARIQGADDSLSFYRVCHKIAASFVSFHLMFVGWSTSSVKHACVHCLPCPCMGISLKVVPYFCHAARLAWCVHCICFRQSAASAAAQLRRICPALHGCRSRWMAIIYYMQAESGRRLVRWDSETEIAIDCEQDLSLYRAKASFCFDRTLSNRISQPKSFTQEEAEAFVLEA